MGGCSALELWYVFTALAVAFAEPTPGRAQYFRYLRSTIGRIEQSNFDTFRIPRMDEVPQSK